MKLFHRKPKVEPIPPPVQVRVNVQISPEGRITTSITPLDGRTYQWDVQGNIYTTIRGTCTITRQLETSYYAS